MSGNAWEPASLQARPWLMRHSHAWSLLRCFVFISVSVVSVGVFGKLPADANIVWLANGLLLAYLLLAPRWRWRGYIVSGATAMVIGSALLGESWRTNLLYNAMNLIEVLTAASLLRRRSVELPRLTDTRYFFRFVGFGVFAGPFTAALLLTAFSWIVWHQQPIPVFRNWFVGDGLGIAVTTPIFIAIFQNSLKRSVGSVRGWCYLTLLAVATLVVFYQANSPLLFVVCPFLLLVLMRSGMGWAGIGTLYVAAIGATLTARGYGPLGASSGIPVSTRPLILQIFLLASVFMLYSVSVVLESHKSMERKLEEIVSVHRLVTENSRDIIILADFTGNRSYVSPAAQALGGWNPEELMMQRTLDLAHPEDQPRLAETMQKMRSGCEGAVIEYRLRKQNAEYVWVESSLRTIHDPSTRIPVGVLNLIRDISERKRTEAELEEAYRVVEALAIVDALTGVANRRRMDQHLHNEWRRAMRDNKPLSLLLLDADHFKPYNDTYGHVRGDHCLKQIAEIAMGIVSRPGDLVARYGGEEFAVVLPNIDAQGAEDIANEICARLRQRNLPHESNPHGVVTLSIGCATLVPGFEEPVGRLVELADGALYRAKQSGRNRVCCAPSNRGNAPTRLESNVSQTA